MARSRSAKHARVVLNLAGKSPAIEESENVRSVTEVDHKSLVVFFGTPFGDELYRCDVIPSEPVGFDIATRTKQGVGIHLAAPWPRKIKIVCQHI
jgi:hypothetical protein